MEIFANFFLLFLDFHPTRTETISLSYQDQTIRFECALETTNIFKNQFSNTNIQNKTPILQTHFIYVSRAAHQHLPPVYRTKTYTHIHRESLYTKVIRKGVQSLHTCTLSIVWTGLDVKERL